MKKNRIFLIPLIAGLIAMAVGIFFFANHLCCNGRRSRISRILSFTHQTIPNNSFCIRNKICNLSH